MLDNVALPFRCHRRRRPLVAARFNLLFSSTLVVVIVAGDITASKTEAKLSGLKRPDLNSTR